MLIISLNQKMFISCNQSNSKRDASHPYQTSHAVWCRGKRAIEDHFDRSHELIETAKQLIK